MPAKFYLNVTEQHGGRPGGGEEALRILGERPVSLILSDQRMPEMTGAELPQRAREIA